MIVVLNRFSSSLNTDTCRCILNAFIILNISYCQPVWCYADKGEKHAMDHVLLRAIHVVLHNRAAVLGRSTYSTTGILPYNFLSKIQCFCTVYYLLQREDAADYLLPLFQCEWSARNMDGRKFVLLHHTLTSIEYCFHYWAAKFWNILPCNFTSLTAFSQFYKFISVHLLSELPVWHYFIAHLFRPIYFYSV